MANRYPLLYEESTEEAPLLTPGALTGPSGGYWTITGAAILDNALHGNTVVVDQTYGSDTAGARNTASFLTITAALAVAQSGDVCLVYPGDYAESFTIPAGVTVLGYGQVSIEGAVGTGTRVTLSAGSALRNVRIEAPTDATACVEFASAGDASIDAVTIIGMGALGYGILNSSTGTLQSDNIIYESGTTDTLFRNTSTGHLHDHNTHIMAGTITTIAEPTGGEIGVDGLTLHSGVTVTNGILMSTTSTEVHLSSVFFDELPTNAVSIQADGVIVNADGCVIQGSTWDWLVNAALVGTNTELTLSGCSFRAERLSFPPAFAAGAAIGALFSDAGVENDRSYRCVSELSVGLPAMPRESSFGEGDSTTAGMVVYSDDGTGTSWVDNTTAAASSAGSTFSLFQSTAIGEEAYIGAIDPREFYGIKADVTTALAYGTGTLVWDYYDGASWLPFDVMCTDADAPYEQYASQCFEAIQNYQVRFDADNFTGWATNSVNGTTAYWVRVTITGTVLGTVPVMQRIKLHTRRLEINPTGRVEYFGPQQPDFELPMALSDGFAHFGGAAPANKNLNVSANNYITIPNSAFSSGDGRSWLIPIQVGLDTCRDIAIDIEWAPSTAAAGTVIWTAYVATPIAVGTQVDAGTVPEVTGATTDNAPGTAGLAVASTLTFRIPDGLPDQVMVIGIVRTGTYAGRANVFSTSAHGKRWR
jgi:hypothetical protein